MHTVLIADTDRRFSRSLANTLAGATDFEVLALLHDGDAVISGIEKHRPQIIILDIIMSGKDGIRIIQYIKKKLSGYEPIIYVITAVSSVRILKTLSEYEIDYFSMKPVDCDIILENLRYMAELSILSEERRRNSERKVKAISPELSVETVNSERITALLRDLGAFPHLRSTESLKNALCLCLENPESAHYITKTLYPTIARLEGLSGASVERRIRYCAGQIQQKKSPLFLQIFSYAGTRNITNSEFILVLTNYLQEH